MAFDERFLEDLRLRADIVDVVSSYIPLKKAGANFKALCPFHKEKTASFVVSPEKQIFHCFGCGKGGNVFGFVMEYEGVSFVEAVELLAKKYNMELPKDRSALQRGGAKTVDIYSVNRYAMGFYSRNLFGLEGKKALQYLLSRGIEIDTIKAFGLGFAVDSWDSLFIEAGKKRVPVNLLLEAGLILKSSNQQGFYDRFRNRIVFPVFDPAKRIVGFGARVLDDSLPKYINSPETRVFKKASLLYGLHLAKEHIKQQGYGLVVEGYMDVLSLYQAGIRNVVAVLGTAFTDRHARLLKRYADKVVMVFDSDEAGFGAVLRSAGALLASDISVKVLRVEGAKDPDEFISKFGAEAFKGQMVKAIGLFEFLLNSFAKKYDTEDTKGKKAFADALFELIKGIDDSIIRSDYLFKIADFVHMKPVLIEQAFAVYLKRQNKGFAQRENTAANRRKLLLSAEKEALALALMRPELCPQILERLSAVDFTEDAFLHLWELLQSRMESGKEISLPAVMADIQNRQVSGLDEFFAICMNRPLEEDVELNRHSDKIFNAIERARIDNQITMVKQRIDKAIRDGNKDEEEKLVRHLSFLFKQRGGASLGKGRV